MRTAIQAHLQMLRDVWKECTPYGGRIIGCNDDQITEITNKFGVLPEGYIDFMRIFGVEAAGLNKARGYEFRYPFVLDYLNGHTSALLKYVSAVSPFVFVTDFDLLLLYFEKNTGENPAIMSVFESNIPGVYYEKAFVANLTDLIFDWVDTCPDT